MVDLLKKMKGVELGGGVTGSSPLGRVGEHKKSTVVELVETTVHFLFET